VLAAAAAHRGVRGDALDVAVAVELTHTASLVLDDLPCMDDADLRRGRAATHRLVGSAGAILLSVGLLARAAELLGRQPLCGGALSEEWGRTVGLDGMAGGQAMDVAASGRLRGAERRLHRSKSAALPAFALSAGARTAGAGDAARAGLEAFGRGLGWAYQLLDDDEDRDEDARQGRAAVGPRPISQSARIMQRAYRRLFQVPGLSDAGLEILVGLAGRVVPVPAARCREAEGASEGRS
jgi:geranylgeranyl pyrophosphate synthase